MSGLRALAYRRKAPSATTIPKTAGAARRSVLRRHEPKETVVTFGKFSWFLDTMCQWHVAKINTETPMIIESDGSVNSFAFSKLDWSADDARVVVPVVVA
jgi:hypothetical protein